jgi:glycosyltransferase involved in cell wall biosynthesis
MPILSIIIPTFNSEKTLRECIDSIIYQTFYNWEIIIVDGLSNDKTVEIANDYNDNRIKVTSESDNGIYDAMNKGISLSVGEWLYFLGSDDKLYNSKVLETVFNDRNLQKFDIVYGNVYSNKHGGVYNGEWNLSKLGYNICHQSIFFKKRVFESLGIYDIKFKVSADHDFNLKWFFSNKLKNTYIDIVIAYFDGSGYSSKNHDVIFERKMNYLIFKRGRKYLKTYQMKEFVARAIVENESNLIFRLYLRLIKSFLRAIIYVNKVV